MKLGALLTCCTTEKVRVWILIALMSTGPLAAQQDTTNLFTLSIEELMDLSVDISTAMKSTTRSDETPAAVFVITRDDIDHMGFRTLTEALNFVPGFTVGKALQSAQQKNIYVRGEFGTQSEGILILYDGQRVNDGITGSGLAFNADYPLDNIRQIEIVRGPVSALYGANAFIAVVNLIPYRPDELQASQIGASGGTQNSLSFSGQQRLNFGKVRASLFARSGTVSQNTGQRDIRLSVWDSDSMAFKPKTLFGRTGIESANTINVGLAASYDKLLLSSYFNRFDASNNWGTGASDDRGNFKNTHLTTNTHVGLKYTDRLFQKHRITLTGSYSTHHAENVYRVENFRSIFHPGFEPPGNASLLESDFGTSSLNMESYAEFNFGKKHKTVVGLNFQQDFIDVVDFSTAILDRNGDGILDAVSEDDTLDTVFGHESRIVYAGFLQHTWSPFGGLSLTGGTRLDRYSTFGNKWSPRLTFVYHPIYPLIVTGMYGKAFRAPSFFETTQSDFAAIGGSRLIENQNLKPETIETFELQVSLRPRDDLSLTANFFYNDLQQVIRRVDVEVTGLPTQSKWENVGSRDWRGVELAMRYTPYTGITVVGNYSFTQTTDERIEDKEKPVIGVPDHALNLAVNLSRKNINLNVNSQSRFGWNDVPAYHADQQIILERINLKSYTIVNARLTIGHVYKSVDLFVDAKNIFDAKSYFTDDRYYEPQGIAGDRRILMIGARIQY